MRVVSGIVGAGVLLAGLAIAARQEPRSDGPPPSRLLGAIDANHDGALSAREQTGAAAALKTLDANADGRLAGAEIGPAFGGPRGRGGEGRGPAAGVSADDLADTLMAFDRNGDGRLERPEVPERFQGLFDRADASRDGLLTRDELKQGAAASAASGDDDNRGRREGRGFARGRGAPMGDALRRALDVNRDGDLSAEEIEGAAAALRVLDVDQDGEISADELRPARSGGRDGRNERER